MPAHGVVSYVLLYVRQQKTISNRLTLKNSILFYTRPLKTSIEKMNDIHRDFMNRFYGCAVYVTIAVGNIQ